MSSTLYSITLPSEQYYKLNLLDMNGRIVSEIESGFGGENEGVLDLSAVPVGVYTLLLEAPVGITFLRLLKI